MLHIYRLALIRLITKTNFLEKHFPQAGSDYQIDQTPSRQIKFDYKVSQRLTFDLDSGHITNVKFIKLHVPGCHETCHET